MSPAPLTGQRILVTGVTGQVAGPLARNLVAAGNTVYGTSRFADPAQREAIEADGIVPVSIDLETARLDEVPDDLDYVVNMAVSKEQDFERALAANAEGAAFLVEKVKGVKAFFHCSSCAVYEPNGQVAHLETDPLGDNHRPMGFMPTYSISKIAAETVLRFAAVQFELPTIIARLSVPYGDNGGWPFYHLMMMRGGADIPIHPEQPNVYNLLHEDDYIAQVPKLLAAARVPAVTVNWGGAVASIEDWCAYLGELTGLEPRFHPTADAFGSLLVVGLTALIAFQAFIIIAGVIRVLPLTGVTLPFVSYGGSSLVANYVLLALLVRVSDQTEQRGPGPAVAV